MVWYYWSLQNICQSFNRSWCIQTFAGQKLTIAPHEFQTEKCLTTGIGVNFDADIAKRLYVMLLWYCIFKTYYLRTDYRFESNFCVVLVLASWIFFSCTRLAQSVTMIRKRTYDDFVRVNVSARSSTLLVLKAFSSCYSKLMRKKHCRKFLIINIIN